MVEQPGKAAIPSDDAIPLTSIEAEVDIVGAVATIHLTHIYTNRTDTPLLTKFTFPVDYEAAVGGLTIETASRTLTAKLVDKEEAESTFSKAVAKGDRGFLLRYDEE